MKDQGKLRGVDSAFGFFRIFDVAFLIPGALVYIVPNIASSRSLLERFWPACPALALLHPGNGWTAQLAILVSLGVVVYVTGIVCHAIARKVRRIVMWMRGGKPPDQEGGDSPSLDSASEIGIYLWNLSSLSWNCAVAVAIGAVLRWKWDGGTAVLLVIVLVLALQGREFRAGYRSMVQREERTRGGTS